MLTVITFMAFFLLAGCGVTSNKITLIKKTWSLLFKKSAPITLARAKKIPHPNIFAALKNNKAILVLIAAIGSERFWASPAGVILVTQNGILKRTDNLPDNLHDLRYGKGFNPLKFSLKKIGKNIAATGSLSLMPQQLYLLPFHSHFTNLGRHTIKTVNGRKIVIKIKQHVQVKSIHWDYNNYYWVDLQSGHIIKSIQYFSPNEAPLKITVVKPYLKKEAHS